MRDDININKFIIKYPDYDWGWSHLSHNKSITLDTITSTKDKPWIWYILTNIYYSRFDVIMKYSDLPWVWYYLSTSKYLTLGVIETLIDKPWDYRQISYDNRRILTNDFILQHPYNNYKLDNISATFTIHDVINFYYSPLSVSLNWMKISASSNIYMDDIMENRDLPWDWSGVSINPNLTNNIICCFNTSHWSPDYMSSNTFEGIVEFSSKNMDMAEQNLKLFKEELIMKTWHPSRMMDWCMSIDDK